MTLRGSSRRVIVVVLTFVTNLSGTTGCAGSTIHPTSHDEPRIDEAGKRTVTATDKPKGEIVHAHQPKHEIACDLTPSARRLTETTLATFVQIRGKAVGFRPCIRRTTHAEMDQLLEQELAAQQPEALSAEFDAVLVAWGLLPAGFSSQRAIIERFKDESYSFYLTTRRTIAIPDKLSPSQLPSSFLHEVVHAYQDEFHRLSARLTYAPGQSDRRSALHAFAEGEALLIERMAPIGTNSGGIPTADALRSEFTRALAQTGLPSILARSLTVPYLDGYRFVTYLHKIGGFSLVDRVWSRGLTSTQELLHPERWVPQCLVSDCQPPIPISRFSAPSPLVTKSRCSYDDSIGEQGLRLLLEHTLTQSEASRLSAAYEADRLSVFRQEGVRDVFWQLHVATPALTADLCSAVTTTLSSKEARVITPGCVSNDRTVMAFSCAKRDILFSWRVRTDTWTSHAASAACRLLSHWQSVYSQPYL